MPDRSVDQIMNALAPYLDLIDQITRSAHARYRGYNPADLIEHDARAQAACTYAHMNAEAERRFISDKDIVGLDIRGLKLWLFKKADAVIRFKKMDEDGNSRTYPTGQAKDFDQGNELPGLPMPPVRLTAGYLLDETKTQFERSQIARPIGRRTEWCAAIVPSDGRGASETTWIDVTRQTRFNFKGR
jgi:hypothetical protein